MLAVVVAWGCYTQHAWEDFYISYRASRNLALGHGLVFQVGERLHTFTSPLHTLLLAGLAKIGGTQEDPIVVLWLYRLVGGIGLGAALFLTHQLGRARGWKGPSWIAGIGLIACDPKAIDFTIAGMEPPLMLFFLALHFHALLGGNGWRMMGLAWAGLMWTRPDAFVFIVASLVATGVFACANAAERRALARRSLYAGLLGAACYAPWLIGATLYYGTPVPHTVVAKGLSLHVSPLAILRSPWEMLVHGGFLVRIFGATFVRLATDWGPALFLFWKTIALVAWLYWLNPIGGRMARTFSLSLFLASLYGANVAFAAWYVPAYALIATLSVGFILLDLWQCTEQPERLGEFLRRYRVRPLLVGLALALVTVQGTVCVLMARSMHWQQALNETGNRRKLGEWLKAHAATGDTLFLECVGYIGYYSGLKTYDFPGMTSREMVDARRRLQTDDFGKLIAELKPDWLVLRPGERDAVKRSQPDLLATADKSDPIYELIRVFDRTHDVAAIPHLLGRRYLEIDQCFEVYRRRLSKPEGTR